MTIDCGRSKRVVYNLDWHSRQSGFNTWLCSEFQLAFHPLEVGKMRGNSRNMWHICNDTKLNDHLLAFVNNAVCRQLGGEYCRYAVSQRVRSPFSIDLSLFKQDTFLHVTLNSARVLWFQAQNVKTITKGINLKPIHKQSEYSSHIYTLRAGQFPEWFRTDAERLKRFVDFAELHEFVPRTDDFLRDAHQPSIEVCPSNIDALTTILSS